jgi:tetratricopeptide (TPR) repeat protein
LNYPDYEPAIKYYERINSAMAVKAAEEQSSDLENISYARGYVSYYAQKLPDAINEWEKVLQYNPKRTELNEYIVTARNYLKDQQRIEKEKRIEEEIKQLFADGVNNFDKGNWVASVKIMEKIRYICQEGTFGRALEWHQRAQGYIAKALKELSKMASKKLEAAKPAESKVSEAEIDAPGAEKKYSEGLVLYAQGKLADAVRQWEIAVRLNPNHEKAQKAISKVKQELQKK